MKIPHTITELSENQVIISHAADTQDSRRNNTTTGSPMKHRLKSAHLTGSSKLQDDSVNLASQLIDIQNLGLYLNDMDPLLLINEDRLGSVFKS